MWYFLTGIGGVAIGYIIGFITVSYLENNVFSEDEWADEDCECEEQDCK